MNPETRRGGRTSQRRNAADADRRQRTHPQRLNQRTGRPAREETERNTYQRIQKKQTQSMSLIILGVFIVAVIVVVRLAKPSGQAEAPAKETAPESSEEGLLSALSRLSEVKIAPKAPTMEGLAGVDQNAAQIESMYTYGTWFNLRGTMDSIVDIQSIQLVLHSLNEQEDALALEMKWSLNEGRVSFSTGESITAGVNLELLPEGFYSWMIRTVSGNGDVVYRTMKNANSRNPIDYYTLTQNGSNRRILIEEKTDPVHNNMPYFSVTVQETVLPEEVYDITIDPGHGGNDGGCTAGGYTEAGLVLDIGMKVKSRLEALGYKVHMTRDGTESADTWMAFNMYDEDGRVTTTCASRSKLCVSLHLNSAEDELETGGLQVYSTARGTFSSAEVLARNIKDATNADYSAMTSYRIADGVYYRPSSSYVPDDLFSSLDELYMIREVGGVATGAYMDGSGGTYHENVYRDSLQGVETFLLELGYITVEKDFEDITEHPDGYADGIANGVREIIAQLAQG